MLSRNLRDNFPCFGETHNPNMPSSRSWALKQQKMCFIIERNNFQRANSTDLDLSPGRLLRVDLFAGGFQATT